MAVAFDAASESHTGTTDAVSVASHTWNHTPAGTPRGVLVFVITRGTSNDIVQSVTYGGVSVPAVSGGFASEAAGEVGATKAFFLGSSIPTGVQAVVVNRTNNTSGTYAVCFTVTAAADTEIEGTPTLIQTDSTIGEVAVDSGAAVALRFAASMSGGSNVAGPGANSNAGPDLDFGTRVMETAYEKVAGSGSRNVGFGTVALDDCALVAVAVGEAAAPSGPTIVHTCGAECASLGSHWTVENTVPPTIDATVKRSGAGSIKVTVAAQTGRARYAYPSAKDRVVFHGYFRFITLPSADQTSLMKFNTTGAPDDLYVAWVNSTKKLRLNFGSTSGQVNADSANAINAGQWYRLDIYWNMTAGAWVAKWSIDGVAQTDATASGGSGTNPNTATSVGASTASTFDMRWDDIAISHTPADYPIADGTVAGTPEVWTAGGAVNYVDGAASLVGVATWSATGAETVSGAATLAGVGSLAAAGAETTSGAATLAGIGSLTAPGQRAVSGASSLPGIATVTAGAGRTISGAGSLPGIGLLAAPGGLVLSGAAALPGIGSLASPGGRIISGAVLLAGVAAVTATGSVAGTQDGAAALTGVGTIVAPASVLRSGAAALIGVGSTVAGGERVASGAASMAGVGTLVAPASGVRSGAASLTGAGTISAGAARTISSAAALAGTGAVGGTARLTLSAAASLAGAGAIAPTGRSTVSGAAALAGAGDLSGTPFGTGGSTQNGAALLAGTGTLAVTAEAVRSGAATLVTVGGLVAGASRTLSAAGLLTGSGGVAATGRATVSAGASLPGAGSLVALGAGWVSGAASLAGLGGLVAAGASGEAIPLPIYGVLRAAGPGVSIRPRVPGATIERVPGGSTIERRAAGARVKTGASSGSMT